jgi:hypothetical protein
VAVRLSGGVVPGRGLRMWAPAGSVLPGAPVVVGPEDADPAAALAELAGLVAAGGVAAAGAGVELGEGFRSARVDGAPGDRRDAVLAALPVVAADRLGDRAGVLVSLFGPHVTKPVGAAATVAVEQGRWSALRLASAASDLLGPEQVQRVLALSGEPVPAGSASALAGQLARVLGPLSRPRRLTILLDLWERVVAAQERERQRQRLRATQVPAGRLDGLRSRYQHWCDELLLAELRYGRTGEPTLAEAARWIPPWSYWKDCLDRAMADAMAATVLARVAVAVFEEGVAAGLDRCAGQLAAAADLIDAQTAGQARRRVPGLPGVPAVPGCYVRDLHRAVTRRTSEEFVRQRLARARDYATVAYEAAEDVLETRRWLPVPVAQLALHGWAPRTLTGWRERVGYAPVRPPTQWRQQVAWDSGQPRPAPLADRLRDDPAAAEYAGDLLWLADLADALAQLNGHEAAVLEDRGLVDRPFFDTDPPTTYPDPLQPRLDSVPAAIAGAATLVGLGATVSPRARTWPELVAGLLGDVAVAEALTGGFPVPPTLAAVDGALLPGDALRFELARGPGQLAEWAAYMGNCIAGEDYLDAAGKGRCALAALRDPDGVLVANVELQPGRQGWRIAEFRARFNAEPDAAVATALREWIATVPVSRPGGRAAPTPQRIRSARRAGHGAGRRLLDEVGPPLTDLAARALGDPDAVAAAALLTGLRRAAPARVIRFCGDALAGDIELVDLWQASAVRPLATALAGLDPVLLHRFERLGRLLDDAPLPGSLRRLARVPEVSAARAADLVARRVRGAVGELARAGDPALAASLTRRPATGMLCALVLAVNAEGNPGATTPIDTTVPGFSSSTVDDPTGPWRRVWPDAIELGADPDRLDVPDLVVPSAWLGPGGWPALWRRAAAQRRPAGPAHDVSPSRRTGGRRPAPRASAQP